MNTKIKPLILAILVATSFSLISCSKEQSHKNYDYAESKEVENTERKPPLANMKIEESKKPAIENKTSASHKLKSKAVNQQVTDKKFVVNAKAVFTVNDVIESVNKIEELTKQNQGFVEVSRIENGLISEEDIVRSDTIIRLSRYVRSAEMTVRIPKENVSKFFKQLQKQIKFLQESEFTAEDVSLDIYREQLANKINSEEFSKLEKKAKEQKNNIEAIDKTTDVKTQQALAKLEKKAIEDKIKYSTIKLSFSQPENIYQKTLANTEQLANSYQPSFQEKLQENLQVGWLSLQAVILKLVKSWWVILLIVLAISIWQILRFSLQKPSTKPKLSKKLANKHQPKKTKVKIVENKSSIQNHKTEKDDKHTNVSSEKTKAILLPPPLPQDIKIQDVDIDDDKDSKDKKDSTD
ncbi:MAG: DUF4349 domain-containing protein [Moraxellaceae bacterium]|nr:DUF4349 domain-containing protein [Moraxellaceae bacterium]